MTKNYLHNPVYQKNRKLLKYRKPLKIYEPPVTNTKIIYIIPLKNQRQGGGARSF
jgi:hypothetical protein